MRIGYGEDTHRLETGYALILGGVKIPFEKGLKGHSDADALTHAVADAVLGALALGDIGKWFPDSDPAYAGICSLLLLENVAKAMREKGWRVGNADAVIVAQRPKLAAFTEEMRENIARALGTETDNISVKASTTEGCGPEGRGECITVRAVCLLERCK